jgi:hypothetical protein
MLANHRKILFIENVPVPLIPHEPATLKLSLTPQPVVLRAVERLRFDVGSRMDLLISDQVLAAQLQMQAPPYFRRAGRIVSTGNALVFSYSRIVATRPLPPP